MAYKARIVTCSTHSQLMKHVKEVMLAAGWINKTPTDQDDPNGHALGFFMNSPGESGNEDIYLHTGLWYGAATAQLPAPIAYLDGNVDITQDTISLKSLSCYTGANQVTFTAPGLIQVDDELIYFTGTDSGNTQLTGCVRGWGTSEAATHSTGAIAVLMANNNAWCTTLQIETFAFSDLTKHLVASDGAAVMTAVGPTSWGTLAGYGDDRFNFHTLLKVVDGAEAGKMRWVVDYTSTGGTIAYQPFLNAPGTVDVKIISGGFFPAWSKRAAYGSSQYRYNGIIGAGAVDPVVQAGRVYFIYCNLDGVVIVSKYYNYYDYFYAGNYIRPHASNTTRSTANSLLTLTFGETYTNCVMSDIGKTVNGSIGSDTGVLVAFNNTSKTWFVAPNDPVDDPFPSGSTITISGGTGGGVTIGVLRDGFKVDNINIMIKDQKYRVISQNVDDWDDNKVPGGSWPNLDPEELASEEFVAADVLPTTRLLQLSSEGYVSPSSDVGKIVVGTLTGDTGYLWAYNDVLRQWTIVPIDSGDEFDTAEGVTIIDGTGAGTTTGPSTNSATGVVQSSTSLINTYLTNAVLGEDPRPLCRVALGNDSNALHSSFRWLTVFQPCKGADLAFHASNRQMHRAYHQSGNRYAPQTTNGNSYARSDILKITQGGTYASQYDRLTDQTPYHLFQLVANYGTESTYSQYGSYNRIMGFIPMTWALPVAAAGGVAGEDVVKTMWNGKYEKFRVFYDSGTGGTWYACGPEILV